MLLSLTIPLLGLFAEVHAVSTEYFSAAARCPFECDSNRDNWAPYHDLSELQTCNKTMLLDLNVYYKIDGQASLFAMRGCAIGGPPVPKLAKRQTLVVPNAPSSHNISTSLFDIRNQTADIQILRFETSIDGTSDIVLADGNSKSAATAALADAFRSTKNGATTKLFAKSGNAVIGVYAGSQIDSVSLSSVIREFAIRVGSSKSAQVAAQLCGPDFLGTQIFGIFLDAGGNLGAARDAVRKWRDADCLVTIQNDNEPEIWHNATLMTIPGSDIVVGPDTSGNGHLEKRATCSYTQAQAGDGCWALADRCKITQEQLKQYNSGKGDVCDAIKEGQYVCCSSGTLPDFSPQPNSDGTCKTTTIGTDFCSVIAEKNQMTVAQIEERNKNTWGWAGCGYLLPGQVLCISTGSPPMPASLPNAVCGPQVPNTLKPSNTNDLASLNPCPLRACCNVWGQCGTTKDFCIKSPADTGAPGTTKPGANSCTYNCGMDVVNNGSPPSSFIKLGYFEAFNQQRPCLKMRPGQISGYTHVHYAFGGISTSFSVDMSGQEMIFNEFKALAGVKRIMSFGGWSFSTEQDTFPIFREGVTAAQRDTFAKNVVKFVTDNGLDGVDFDWEYPAAPDIPGIPPGSKEDGQNYLAFLKLVRSYLPSGKSIAVAAPASFWYLKGFPIEDMSKILDYIVYMTYDIHGQWDYGNKWTSEGCANGDCLRSHVNRTETLNAMSMITKAGVPASKILIGMALYGRTFKMVDPGCRGPNCKFTGPDADAQPGRCTGTRGYMSNFEIREIQSSGSPIQEWTNQDGDYMIFDNDNWVSWMTKATYARRLSWVQGLNFGGTADWAIDLDADYTDGGGGSGGDGGDSGSGPILIDPSIYTSSTPAVRCYPQCTFVFPPMVLPTPTTISISPETVTYEERWTTTSTVSGAIITETGAWITSTVITLPPVTTTEIEIWNYEWSGSTESGSTFGIVNLTMSVSVPPRNFYVVK